MFCKPGGLHHEGYPLTYALALALLLTGTKGLAELDGAGLSDDNVSLFCSMAACADYGALEAARFKVDIATWKPGQEGC